MIRKRLIFAVIFALGWGLPALAQGRRNQGQAVPPPQETQQIGPSARSKAESDAFNAIQMEQNPANVISLSDKFMMTYANSQLIGYIQRFRMFAFSRLGNYKDAVAAGEVGLSSETKYLEDVENPPDKSKKVDKNSQLYKAFVAQEISAKLNYYQVLMTSYQELNDAPKSIEYGEKALAQKPDDLVSLLTVSSVLANRPPGDDKQKEDQMKRALDLGKKAADQVTAIVSGPAGAQMKEEQKEGLVSQVHQTLGMANLHLKKLGDAQKEYLLAIGAKKDDPISYYGLGMAYAQDKKLDQAMDALAKAVYLKFPQDDARKTLELLYQDKNKSTNGIDDFIQKAGQKIGQ